MMLNKEPMEKQGATSVGQSCQASSAFKGVTARVIGAIALVLLVGSSAFGQLIIQPMIVEVAERPNKPFSAYLTLENISNVNIEEVDIRLVDISQDPNGTWLDIKPGVSDHQVLERSCASWLSLDTESLTLGPNEREHILLQGRVKSGQRGYFCAGILARTRPRMQVFDDVSAAMAYEFLIPIIIEVQGRSMPDEISVVGEGLKFSPQTSSREAETLVTMTVRNEGGTFARLNANSVVWAQQGGHWRKITEKEFPEKRILPGVTFTLAENVGRPLRAGAYKVQTFLYVNGRRADFHETSVQFQGDSRAVFGDVQLPDAVLLFDPSVVNIEGIPGGKRQDAVTVINSSEETVNVQVEVAMPKQLGNMAVKLPDGSPLIGDYISCAPWVKVYPEEFSMRGYGRQNIRVIADMPESAGEYPNYYGVIKLHATYPDGQIAGTAEGYAFIKTRDGVETPVVEGMQLTVGESGPGRYIVSSRFVNKGNTHVSPVCEGVLTRASDNSYVKRFIMSTQMQSAYMLPFESRSYSGILDVGGLPDGNYRVIAYLQHDKGVGPQQRSADCQQGIKIATENGTKTVEVIGLDAIGGAVQIQL